MALTFGYNRTEKTLFLFYKIAKFIEFFSTVKNVRNSGEENVQFYRIFFCLWLHNFLG